MSDDLVPAPTEQQLPPLTPFDPDDWYQQHKRALAMAVLPDRHYRRAFEPGCGDGALAAELARRCDSVVCWDADPLCAAAAGIRLADVGNAHVAQGSVPADWPDGTADLVVLSEVGCFLPPADLDLTLERCAATLEPGGVLVALHKRTAMPHYPGGGDDVHARLFCLRSMTRIGGYTDEGLRIDIFERHRVR